MCVTYQLEKQSCTGWGAQNSLKISILHEMRKAERGFLMAKGVGESGNEPAGTLTSTYFSTGVEIWEVKQGVLDRRQTTRSQYPL